MTSIHTNISAMAALHTLRSITTDLSQTQNRVSSGLRVNTASENSAYWSIATTMRSDQMALSAVSDALGLAASIVDVAYLGLNAVIEVMGEFKAKVIASKEPGVDKVKIQSELEQLKSQVRSIAESASFSGTNWLNTDIDDIYDVETNKTSILSSFGRRSAGVGSVSIMDFHLSEVSLFNSTQGGLLQRDGRDVETIAGLRHMSYIDGVGEWLTYNPGPGRNGTMYFDFSGPLTFVGPTHRIRFDVKFDTALRNSDHVDDDANIFVLVDESHRTQTGKFGGHGQFAIKMRKLLPKACYIGFTGTPLLKKDKNTLSTFGGLIHKYAIDEAVADGAVVPLLYEGRLVEQQVSGDVIDKWFDKISEGLTDQQKADLKRKFSRLDALNKTGQAIRAKAFDISEHYRKYWQNTGFKAQLVAPSKAAAIRFKEVLDEIGHVSSAVIISPPDDNEDNEEIDQESKSLIRAFWDKMMVRYKSEDEFNRQLIEDFKGTGDPEILIVVSKLLTGFDAPRNTVLYVCKPLKEHNLLQAIARVNRLFENEEGTPKEFGVIIDYEGLLGELDKALTTYSAFEGYETTDVADAVHDVREEIRRLPQLHDQLWDLFKPIRNKKDMEQFEQLLADEALRHDFYERLKALSRCLHISMSSDKFLDVFDDKKIGQFKRDWKQFSELRRSVQIRYQEIIDVKEYEPKIQKLLDDHVVAMPAETIIELVNINDPAALNAAIEETGVSTASKADRIASATRRAISERMDEDPTLYRAFSELLRQTIEDYRAKRLSEREYLKAVSELASQVAAKDRGEQVPATIKGSEDGQAFYGILKGKLSRADQQSISDDEVASIAIKVIEIIKSHHIVGVWSNEVTQNNMRNAIDDYFFDVVRDEAGIELCVEALDELEQQIMNLARARFPG